MGCGYPAPGELGGPSCPPGDGRENRDVVLSLEQSRVGEPAAAWRRRGTALPPVGWCRGVAGAGPGGTGGVRRQSTTLRPGQSLSAAVPDAFRAV